MNDHPAPEPPLDDLAREFPGWEGWRGISVLVYARLPGTSPPMAARAGDPLNLRDQIRAGTGRRSR